MSQEQRINEIKEEIRTINPDINDKLLDLLYEYVMERFMGHLLHKED